MPRLARPTPTARAAALLALGALAVHELRYLLAYGAHSQAAMASQGHGYLGELAPALLVFALSLIAGRVVAAASGRRESLDGTGAAGGTLTFGAALVAIFAIQELAEGAVFAGHAAGLAAVFAGGGWLAVPVALAIGRLCACADRFLAGTERALARQALRRRSRRAPRAPAQGLVPRSSDRVALAASPLAFGLARRPPPGLSTSG